VLRAHSQTSDLHHTTAHHRGFLGHICVSPVVRLDDVRVVVFQGRDVCRARVCRGFGALEDVEDYGGLGGGGDVDFLVRGDCAESAVG